MVVIGSGHCLAVGAVLLTLWIACVFLNRKSVSVFMLQMPSELIRLAVNIKVPAFSTVIGDVISQVLAVSVPVVAAAQAGIGLAVPLVFFRNRRPIAVENVNLMGA